MLSPIYSDTTRANSANSVAGADSASANFANTINAINTIDASNNLCENPLASDLASLKSLLLSLDLSPKNSKQDSKKSSPQNYQVLASYQTPKDYQKHWQAHWRALLHYGKRRSSIPKKSPFFLSKKGYKNPQDEYIATINALFDEIESSKKIAESSADSGAHFGANLDSSAHKSDNSTICKYPARMDFIATILQDITSQSTSKNVPSDTSKTPEKSHENQESHENPANPTSPANLAKLFTSLTDNAHCEGLQEFLSIVPIDKITLEFAAESDMYPGSSMGHVYLHLQGIMRDDIQREFEGALFSRKKGDVQEYGMSYYALMSDFFNPLDYARAMVGNLKGHYVLSPYENLKTEYLQNQKRTLYRFALKATPTQKRHFALHLWELRDRQIHYSFITHNCTDGIEEILGVLDSKNFYAPKILGVSKPFITPAEYLQHLDKQGQIVSKDIMLAERKKSFAKHFGYNDVLHSRKGSKLSFGYEFPNQIYINFAPIYSDIKNADSAYKEHIESRLASIELRVAWRGGFGGVGAGGASVGGVGIDGMDRRGLDSMGLGSASSSFGGAGFGDSSASLDSSSVDSGARDLANTDSSTSLDPNVANSSDLDSSARVFVPKIELIHLFSIADFARTKTLSKLISIRLESNLYEHASAQNFSSFLNHSTRLFPSIEFGLGFGAYASKLAFFALPSIGYRYEIIHNPYAMLKIGAIARLGRVRVVADHSVYYDIIGNNRGYDNKLGAFVGINVYKQVDIFVDSGAYWSAFDNAKIAYDRAHTWSIKGGISVNF